MSTTSFIDFDGCRLNYRVRGSGPPVLLIQGVGVHGDGWNPQADELSHRFRCLTFDNRGMGNSQPLSGKLTVEQMASDAKALMDAEGWSSAHVIGHSLGGLVALQLALNAQNRIRSLSLLCTFARGRDATKLTPTMLWLGTRTRIGTRRMRRRAFLRLVMPPDALATLDPDALAARLEPLFGHDLADPPPVTMKQLNAMKLYDATPRLHELAGIPTLVVSAAYDPIARPSSGRAIASGIPGATYIELADASHGVTIQQPRRLNAMLIDHLTAAEEHSTCMPPPRSTVPTGEAPRSA